jgi:N-acetyl-alpha-D-muramate 1-phosphate uridylyltransferase
MSAIKVAMILAAGRGERMRPLTDTLPKPLAPVNGTPIIVHTINQLGASGIERIVINLSYRGQQIRDALQNGHKFGVEIVYSDEGDHVLGTGGGVVKALPLLGRDPFWLVSGDLWSDYPFAERSQCLAANDLAHLVMVPNPDFHPQGDFYLQDHRLSAVLNPALTSVSLSPKLQRLTYGSIGCFRPELFTGCTVDVASIAPWLIEAMSKDRVSGECFKGLWFNVGTLAQLNALEQRVAKN